MMWQQICKVFYIEFVWSNWLLFVCFFFCCCRYSLGIFRYCQEFVFVCFLIDFVFFSVFVLIWGYFLLFRRNQFYILKSFFFGSRGIEFCFFEKFLRFFMCYILRISFDFFLLFLSFFSCDFFFDFFLYIIRFGVFFFYKLGVQKYFYSYLFFLLGV